MVDATGAGLTHVRAMVRPVESIFGEIDVPRLSYGGREKTSLLPQDAANAMGRTRRTRKRAERRVLSGSDSTQPTPHIR